MRERWLHSRPNAWAKTRSRIDITHLWLRHHWSFAVSLILVALGLAIYFTPGVALAIGLLATFLGIVVAVLDVIRYRNEVSDLNVVRAGVRPVSSMRPSGTYDGYIFEEAGNGVMLRSELVDRGLASLPTTAFVQSPSFELPAIYSDLELIVVRHERKGSIIFNGKGMRLETDFSEAACSKASSEVPVELTFRELGFFSNLVTNRFFGREVVSRRTGRTVFKGETLLLDETGMIRDLAHAWMANLVGISTLAVCSDGRVLLVDQTNENADNGGMVVPSGSGSLDPVDVTDGGSLQEAITHGMERELREECNIPDEIGLSTTVTGFGRWIDRGGKPEFFGFTEVDVPSTEIEGIVVRRDERSFVGRVKSRSRTSLLESNAIAADINWSLPLGACVNRYRDFLERNP